MSGQAQRGAREHHAEHQPPGPAIPALVVEGDALLAAAPLEQAYHLVSRMHQGKHVAAQPDHCAFELARSPQALMQRFRAGIPEGTSRARQLLTAGGIETQPMHAAAGAHQHQEIVVIEQPVGRHAQLQAVDLGRILVDGDDSRGLGGEQRQGVVPGRADAQADIIPLDRQRREQCVRILPALAVADLREVRAVGDLAAGRDQGPEHRAVGLAWWPCGALRQPALPARIIRALPGASGSPRRRSGRGGAGGIRERHGRPSTPSMAGRATAASCMASACRVSPLFMVLSRLEVSKGTDDSGTLPRSQAAPRVMPPPSAGQRSDQAWIRTRRWSRLPCSAPPGQPAWR
jgi:hypothetical protein